MHVYYALALSTDIRDVLSTLSNTPLSSSSSSSCLSVALAGAAADSAFAVEGGAAFEQ